MNVLYEYIWIDANGKLRSKTKVEEGKITPRDWSFDGSSTGQSTAEKSDLLLRPVRTVDDPIRKGPHRLVLCEVLTPAGKPVESNYRERAVSVHEKHRGKLPWFGIEQEYTFTMGRNNMPLGLTMLGFANHDIPKQGQFYCGVGSQNVFGRKIVEEHLLMMASIESSLICGINAEVMPGQWEFQIGPGSPVEVADRLWIARYLLVRVAEKHGVAVSFAAKPHPELNGAGAHTNFSTSKMRESFNECVKAAQKLGGAVLEHVIYPAENKTYDTISFPSDYGTGHENRLTGDCETSSYKEFKFGIADRTASIRIPLHVAKNGMGYIEDRRPCADADPYRVVAYIMETVLD